MNKLLTLVVSSLLYGGSTLLIINAMGGFKINTFQALLTFGIILSMYLISIHIVFKKEKNTRKKSSMRRTNRRNVPKQYPRYRDVA